MKAHKNRLKISFILSIFSGLVFLLILNPTSMHNHIQNGLLCFLIGFSIIWLLYLSFWFISNGFKKTAFPKQSKKIVAWIKQHFKKDMLPYQEKMMVEIAGTVIMIVIGLSLATAALIIISGLMYTVGKIFW